MNKNEKIEINKNLVGKIVLVLTGAETPWRGEVSEVLDEETFLVKNLSTKREKEVDIFDIRNEGDLIYDKTTRRSN
mgnify:CR=1 FL=1